MPSLREQESARGHHAPDHALPLPSLPQVLLGQDRHSDAVVQAWLPDLDDRHLPAQHRAPENVEHEASLRSWHHATVGVAPRAPHPRDMGRDGWSIRRSRRCPDSSNSSSDARGAVVLRGVGAVRLASFFAGIGGFDLGFERAGCEVVFQCEIDPHCQQVLRRHWPDIPLHDDIRTLEPGGIPDAEIWSAGWPCQDVSAGNAQRTGLSGERSGLFFDFFGLALQVRPRWIILENVPGLISADGGTALESVIDQMEEGGYLGGWTTCNTLNFGLPQDRERIIIVGSLGTDSAYQVLAHGRSMQGDHPPRGTERPRSSVAPATSARGDDPIVVQRRGGFGYTRGSHVCPTLRAQSGRHQGGHSDRPILCGAELDLERMGEADGLSGRMDSRRGRLIGNAVAVPIAQWFAESILAVEANGSPNTPTA